MDDPSKPPLDRAGPIYTMERLGEVELDLAAQCAFRADGKHVANNEHPNHQYRINRRSSNMRIVRRQFGPNP
jgi:hypothetical protein